MEAEHLHRFEPSPALQTFFFSGVIGVESEGSLIKFDSLVVLFSPHIDIAEQTVPLSLKCSRDKRAISVFPTRARKCSAGDLLHPPSSVKALQKGR